MQKKTVDSESAKSLMCTIIQSYSNLKDELKEQTAICKAIQVTQKNTKISVQRIEKKLDALITCVRTLEDKVQTPAFVHFPDSPLSEPKRRRIEVGLCDDLPSNVAQRLQQLQNKAQ